MIPLSLFLVLPQKPPPDCRSFLFLYVSIYVYVTGKYCFSVINMANITLFMAYLCVSSIFKYHHQLFYGIKCLVLLCILFQLFHPNFRYSIKRLRLYIFSIDILSCQYEYFHRNGLYWHNVFHSNPRLMYYIHLLLIHHC